MKTESLDETIRRVLRETEIEAAEATKFVDPGDLASSTKIEVFLKGDLPEGFGAKAVGLAILAANLLATQKAEGGEWDIRQQMLATGIDDILKANVGLTNGDISEQIGVVDAVIDRPIHIFIL